MSINTKVFILKMSFVLFLKYGPIYNNHILLITDKPLGWGYIEVEQNKALQHGFKTRSRKRHYIIVNHFLSSHIYISIECCIRSECLHAITVWYKYKM